MIVPNTPAMWTIALVPTSLLIDCCLTGYMLPLSSCQTFTCLSTESRAGDKNLAESIRGHELLLVYIRIIPVCSAQHTAQNDELIGTNNESILHGRRLTNVASSRCDRLAEWLDRRG